MKGVFKLLIPTFVCSAVRSICREELSSDNIIDGLSGKVIRAGRTLPRGGVGRGGRGGIPRGGVAIAFDIPDPRVFDIPAPRVVTVVVGGD